EPFWALGRLLGVPTAVIPRNRASSAGRAVSIWPFLSSTYALALVAPPLRKSLVIRDLVSRNRTRKTTAPHLLEKWQAGRKRPREDVCSRAREARMSTIGPSLRDGPNVDLRGGIRKTGSHALRASPPCPGKD